MPKMVIGDEPAIWPPVLRDAILQSLGKIAGQRVLLAGTQAPASDDHWWPALVGAGTTPDTHVKVYAAPEDAPWDKWDTIRRANPLAARWPPLRKRLIAERDAARRDPSLVGPFRAFRLNQLVGSASTYLIDRDDWRRVERRPVAPREGLPIVGIDLGSENWSAASCIWPTGRIEVYGSIGGAVDLETREKRAGLKPGTLARLMDDRTIDVDPGRHVCRPQVLLDLLEEHDIQPALAIGDRFKHGELVDAIGGRFQFEPRRTRWSESTADISAFRRLALDGEPALSVAPHCRRLAALSLAHVTVKRDDAGNTRLISTDRRKPDDVGAALVLAAGALSRALAVDQVETEGFVV